MEKMKDGSSDLWPTGEGNSTLDSVRDWQNVCKHNNIYRDTMYNLQSMKFKVYYGQTLLH